MSWPHTNPQPYGHPQPYPHPYPPAPQAHPQAAPPYPPVPQPYPAPRQPLHSPTPWPAHAALQANHSTAPAAGNEPLFQVRITKHTGAVIVMFNQTYTVTGTFAQCEAALRNALLHNLLAGWWGIWSALICNWVALVENHNARKHLHRQAAQYAAQAAAWNQPTAPPNPTTNT